MTHEVTQRLDPGGRMVHVDNDPVVLAHARALLVGTPEGAADYLEADPRDVDRMRTAAQETLDLPQPVALMLVAILRCVPDADDPCAITRRLLDALAPGSPLVPSHPTADIGAGAVTASTRVDNERAADHAGATPRTHAEVTRFFAGTDLLDPGVVELPDWHPGPGDSPAAPAPSLG